jgi:pectin-derived oligosaccharide transport system substrate-binding protein
VPTVSRRSLLFGALAGAATLPLAGCGGGSGGGSGNTNDKLSTDPVTLRMTWWGGDERHNRTKQVIELFQQKYPRITVKPEFKDWSGYWDKLATAVAANDAPDVIQMDEAYIAAYSDRGALLDLKTQAKNLSTKDFDAKSLATGLLKGKQFGLPTGLTVYSILANTDLLAKYNIALPNDETWTWDDFKALGAQVSKASGGQVFGVQSWGFDTGCVNVWARQRGSALYSDAGKVSLPAAVLADEYTYLLGLAKDGVAPPVAKTVELDSATLNQTLVSTRGVALATCWNSQLSSYATASKSKLKLLKLPGEAAAKSPGAYYKPSMYWSASSRAKHPAEAALLIDFLANSEQAANIFLTDRGIPANTKMRTVVGAKATGTDKDAMTYLDSVKVGTSPRITPNGASTVEAILKRHTEDVLFAKATPQQGAEAFIKDLQAEIDAV